MEFFKTWYLNQIKARFVFIPYWLVKFAFIFLSILKIFKARKKLRNSFNTSIVCMERGIKGWDLIDGKELYESACEYLNANQVYKMYVNPDSSYVKQVKETLDKVRPTHYFYDPRTGSQDWLIGLWQSFIISLSLYWRNIIPIVFLTDFPVRSWRTQSAVVSANSGVVVTLMASRMIHPIFPHSRLVTPSLMPFSKATLENLNIFIESREIDQQKKAVFIGSLYEPRTTILNEISEGLKSRNLNLEIRGRRLGSSRVSDSDYWYAMINAPIVITTAEQISSKSTDWAWIPHLIYRYLEVMACGTLLVAPVVPGIQRFFIPGVHFVAFTSTSNAVDVLEYYLLNEKERNEIAANGKTQAEALINSRTFWMGIDIGLGKQSLT